MRRLLLASLLVLVLAPAAAPAATGYDPSTGVFLVDGQPAFPIGLSNGPPLGARAPSGGDALALLARKGVGVVRVGPSNADWTDATLASVQAWDRATATLGMHTWVNLRELARAQPGTAGDAMLRRVVTTLAGDPGLGFWKGADEPWWSHWAPSVLQYGYCETTARGDPSWCQGAAPLDGAHAWITIQAPRGTAADLAPYSAVTDSHGVDDYPVTLAAADPDLHQVGLWTRTLASITPGHAVWATLQICASGSYDGTGRFVLPTAAQERFMVYDAIVNGARALHAALVRPDPASDGSLASSDSQTELLMRRTPTDVWVIAARFGAGTTAVTISGLPAGTGRGSVYAEGRKVRARHGAFSDSFSRWTVHVYRFPQ